MDVFGQILLGTIWTGGGYALLSLGFNLFYKTRKFVDISYGSLIIVGAYSMLFFVRDMGLIFWPALLLSLLVTVAVALLLDLFIYNPLKKKKAASLIPLIASLGVNTAIVAIIAMLFSSQHQALYSGETRVFSIIGGNISFEIVRTF